MPRDPYGVEGDTVHGIPETALIWDDELQEYVTHFPDDDSE